MELFKETMFVLILVFMPVNSYKPDKELEQGPIQRRADLESFLQKLKDLTHRALNSSETALNIKAFVQGIYHKIFPTTTTTTTTTPSTTTRRRNG